ncbi:hypothetical protein BV20DRAFT_184879 [Pilatotrama ljubarskyi]|nr:hypothetical protein BV20DRAFT_184879 [Pilatotrama ljubarskyi]
MPKSGRRGAGALRILSKLDCQPPRPTLFLASVSSLAINACYMCGTPTPHAASNGASDTLDRTWRDEALGPVQRAGSPNPLIL